jgi:hypothetical protein
MESSGLFKLLESLARVSGQAYVSGRGPAGLRKLEPKLLFFACFGAFGDDFANFGRQKLDYMEFNATRDTMQSTAAFFL